MWWDNLTSLQQVSFIIACAATLIMIIFIILMLIGMDGSESFDGFEADFDADFDLDVDDLDGAVDVYNNDSLISISGLKILTIRGILAFLSIGGWVVFGLADSMQTWLALLLGLIAGAAAAVLLAYAMKAAMRLEKSGNLDYRSAVGKTATVYIRVPKEAKGKGKVIFNHQGRMVEVDAMTRSKEDITAKNEVKIIGLEDSTTLVVRKLKEEEE